MKYNILTVASKSYAPFLDIFINSLFTNGNVEDLVKLYIVGVDLDKYKNHFLKSSKIVYIDSSEKDEYSGIHTEGWYKNTSLKTKYLSQLLSSDEVQDPIILIDSDVVVLKDLSSLINLNYDMQFTTMSEGSHMSASGVEILHIGCLTICNNKELAKKFVAQWALASYHLKITHRPKPHETPAMNIIINIHENKKTYGIENQIAKKIKQNNEIKKIKIGYLNDKLSCSDKSIYPQTVTLHFKTAGGTNVEHPLEDFQRRVSNISCFDPNLENLELHKYLNTNLLEKWINEKHK